jgi:AraC family transcriptional activator of tynA and feaB
MIFCGRSWGFVQMTLTLCTSSVDRNQRFRFWQEAVCETFVSLDLKRSQNDFIEGSITTTPASKDLALSVVRSVPQQVVRTRQRILRADSHPIFISVQIRGAGVIAQDDRVARLQEGDFALYDTRRPYTLNFLSDFEQLVIEVPRDIIQHALGDTRTFTATAIERSDPNGALITDFLLRLFEIADRLKPESMARISSIALDLLQEGLCQHFVGSGIRHGSAVLAMQRAKALIESKLHDPSLDATRVAKAAGTSLRSLQSLFHAESECVSEYIWSRRLARAHERLVSPLFKGASIGSIALDCGFLDQAHFSRRFRKAFGKSPSEMKAKTAKPEQQ